MGADYDSRLATGRTPQEAFIDLVDRIRHQHGHGGYSGTLAEKHSYVLVELPARMTADKLERLAIDVPEHDGRIVADIREGLRYATSPAKRRQLEAEAKKQERDDAKFWKAIPVHARAAVREASRVADDKWGPAAMVEVSAAEARAARVAHNLKRGTKVYRVFGYCSS